MALDHLWAGWRMAYVSEASDAVAQGERGATDARPEAEAGSACVFCSLLASGEADHRSYVLWRGQFSAAILNAYPYASGHILAMPLRHVSRLDELPAAESSALWATAVAAAAALERAYRPDGMNLGANLGRAAGAGIPGHLHLHVLPRWFGDTSFMTAVAEARVLPEALGDTWRRLREAWPAST